MLQWVYVDDGCFVRVCCESVTRPPGRRKAGTLPLRPGIVGMRGQWSNDCGVRLREYATPDVGLPCGVKSVRVESRHRVVEQKEA